METPEWVKRAKVGDKVVMVKTTTNCDERWKNISTGDVFTIHSIEPERFFHDGIDVSFNFTNGMGGRWIYFKPLSKRGTDKGMKILKGILNKPHVPIQEDA